MIIFPKKNYKLKSSAFESDYIHNLKSTFDNLDLKKVSQISILFESAIKNNNNIFILGNGGSAAVSNHFVCDFNKGLKSIKKGKAKFISLTNSVEIITAISNDINFTQIFTNQLENFYKKGDLIYMMSCSGTSPNIINALKFCKKKKAKVIFITGFLKRKINFKFKVFINLSCRNYGICEDVFSSIMHITYQKLKVKNSKKKLKII